MSGASRDWHSPWPQARDPDRARQSQLHLSSQASSVFEYAGGCCAESMSKPQRAKLASLEAQISFQWFQYDLASKVGCLGLSWSSHPSHPKSLCLAWEPGSMVQDISWQVKDSWQLITTSSTSLHHAWNAVKPKRWDRCDQRPSNQRSVFGENDFLPRRKNTRWGLHQFGWSTDKITESLIIHVRALYHNIYYIDIRYIYHINWSTGVGFCHSIVSYLYHTIQIPNQHTFRTCFSLRTPKGLLLVLLRHTATPLESSYRNPFYSRVSWWFDESQSAISDLQLITYGRTATNEWLFKLSETRLTPFLLSHSATGLAKYRMQTPLQTNFWRPS